MFSSTYLITVAQEHKGVWGVNSHCVPGNWHWYDFNYPGSVKADKYISCV